MVKDGFYGGAKALPRTMNNERLGQRDRVEFNWAERVESLKAAMVGGIAATVVWGLLLQLNSVVWLPHSSAMAGVPTWKLGMGLWLSGAIAQISGALFAITYRYIVRQDTNPHLRSGTVGAFGLVRGLAAVEIGWQTNLQWPALVVLVAESFVLFGGIQGVLDWAIAHRWVKPLTPPN